MSFDPVVPSSINRAKRLAKALQAAYPGCSLATCQALTAQLLFHQDWHALETAIKTKQPSAPFDDDADSETVAARYRAQLALLCGEMHQIDVFGDYPSPEGPPSLRSLIEGPMSEYHQKRLKMARSRWAVLYVCVVIMELAPTAGCMPQVHPYPDIGLVSSEWLLQLPKVLGRWWRHNIPHTPPVANNLASIELNPNKLSDLLRFGAKWGTLCFYYMSTIHLSFGMGVTYLLGERYGVLTAFDSEIFAEYSALDEPTQNEYELYKQALNELILKSIGEFFEVIPRDDYHSAFLARPDAVRACADDCIKILSRPYSRRGTWPKG